MLDSPRPEVARFLADAEARLRDLSIECQTAEWVYSTYLTPDTETLSTKANMRLIATTVELAKRSTSLVAQGGSAEEARKLRLLRLTLPLIAPSDPAESEELARRVASMQGTYAKGRHTLRGTSEPLDLQSLSHVLEESRDPARLEDAWTGWHRVGRSVRPDFERYVELANRGARELGFADTGAMWRSKYDMDPHDFAHEVDRLWREVEPLYRALHAYVRARLVKFYGPERVDPKGPIPAHLLGNMWAQSWEGIYPLLAPPSSDPGLDLTQRLLERKVTPIDMVRYAERFFSSLGFDPLPPSFWERSMFVRPRDREVVCHASAWDLDGANDLRIKMCIEVTGEDFRVIHHELGHNYYQRAYAAQPFLFQDSAHDGFHEAVGDTIALSVTPSYLARIGLLDSAPDAEGEIGPLLHRALEKISFLPFGLLVDRWRWEVFSGAVSPAEYNSAWWEMRERLQGIAPPAPREAEEFDPGAKYHVSANVPYMRYFLAHILQFQFHRALVRSTAEAGPVHRASIYGSEEAGRRLRSMLEMGQRHEWPDALEALTGERKMEGGSLREYFRPLERWLEQENRGVPIGW